MTGAQAMSTPTPGRPRRSSKMPRMGAANVAMKSVHQTVAAPASPCMPSGPPPKMKPERPTSSTARARSATTPMAQKNFKKPFVFHISLRHAVRQLLDGDAADLLVTGGAPRPAVLAATNRRHRASNTQRFIWPPQVRWYYAHTIRPKGGDFAWRDVEVEGAGSLIT